MIYYWKGVAAALWRNIDDGVAYSNVMCVKTEAMGFALYKLKNGLGVQYEKYINHLDSSSA